MSSDGRTVSITLNQDQSDSAVRILDWNGDTWVQRSSDLGPSDVNLSGDPLTHFNDHTLSSDGNTLRIRRAWYPKNAITVTMQWNENVKKWEQIPHTFNPTNWGQFDLTPDENTLILGNPSFQPGTYRMGSVTVYGNDGEGFNNVIGQVLTGAEYDLARLGRCVSISDDGNTIAIHATDLYDMPAAVIFEWDGAKWVQKGGQINEGDKSAAELSIAGDGNSLIISEYSAASYTGKIGVYTDGSILSNINLSYSSVSLAAIDGAIQSVTNTLAGYGALHNRLEYAADNLANIAQNTEAARSRILDTDYASETTELARTQIIQQAATAMLTQANQQAKYVLELLKSV